MGGLERVSDTKQMETVNSIMKYGSVAVLGIALYIFTLRTWRSI